MSREDATLGRFDDASGAVTYRWRPDGEPCAECGRVTEALWLAGDTPLCADCTAWR